jgi:hypothetical protein
VVVLPETVSSATVVADARTANPLEASSVPAARAAPAPFALPPLEPRWRAVPKLGEASLYLRRQFFPDCEDPIAVSGFEGPPNDGRSAFSVTAFRCAREVPERDTPEPWYSDGSVFLWVARGALVIEVDARRHLGPRPMQWKAYLDRAVASLPRASPPPAREPIDRMKAKAFVAALRASVAAARRGACLKDVGTHRETLSDMMKKLVGSGEHPEVLWNATNEASSCRECMSPGDPLKKGLCDSAAESIDDAEDWLRIAGG